MERQIEKVPMKILKDKQTRIAILIGALCTIAHFSGHSARNILSIFTQQIVDNGAMTLEYIGTLSTENMICYASGQLINGFVGDKVKTKYLATLGLLVGGISNMVVGLANIPSLILLAYGMSGFCLSTLNAPLVKLIAENTKPIHAERCCLALTFASMLGAPTAGALALIFAWRGAFIAWGVFLIAIGVGFYIFAHLMEHKGIVTYPKLQRQVKNGGNVKVLIENQILKYTFVSILTGIVRTSVMFWIPTYLAQYLGFGTGMAATLFTVISLTLSVSMYVTNVLIYEKVLKRNLSRMILLMFVLSSVSFAFMFFTKNPIVNILLLTMAMATNNGGAQTMWNVYCPSLHHTGMVSTATGYLEFVSYLAAGIANLLFANAITQIGWGNLILVWALLMGAGVIVSLPWKKSKKIIM